MTRILFRYIVHAVFVMSLVLNQSRAAEIDATGVWVTNQGLLSLTHDDGKLSGTFDDKTSVAGSIEGADITLEYKRGNVPVAVTLQIQENGWLSGEAKTSRSTTPWFGCRESRNSTGADEPNADFSGHWLWSWGIVQLQQKDVKAHGTYGADEYGEIDGTIKGRRMNLQWKRAGRSGRSWVEQSPNGKNLIGRTIGNKPTIVVGLRANKYQLHAEPVAGQVVYGRADNGMLYHLRMPDDWKAGAPVDVVVLLHGSNFTTAGMVPVFAKNWPELAKNFAVLGIQGEQWAKWSSEKDLRFNYTYVSWVGRSTYKGFPYTDRASPALVMDVIDDLKKRQQFERVFVGGHSQGGFLTYFLHMNFPEQIAGSFPIAGGLVFQTEPGAFKAEALIASQRETPMVIVHGQKDRVVRSSVSDSAYQKFLAHDFAKVRLMQPNAGHAFDFLPIGDAVRWLDIATTSDTSKLSDWAKSQVAEKNWRQVGVAVARARELNAEQVLSESIAAYEAAASEQADKHLSAIQSNINGEWVDDFLKWQEDYSASQRAVPLNQAFDELRAIHAEPAKQRYSNARKAFRAGKADEGWKLYREIIDQHYAAVQYRTLRDSVRKHFEE